MTLRCTLPSDRNGAASHILRTYQSDGILYYIVICSANIVLTVMIVRAPPALKGVAAQLVFLLTVVMTSRVTLHLKKPVNSPCNQYQSCCTIYPPTVLKSAPGHRQMSRKLFVDNPKLRVPRSTNPIPSVSIDFDTTDDAQSFRSVDVESL